jgi:hypothetical protein
MNADPLANNAELDSASAVFEWLLVLGFPASLAAAKAAPQFFKVEDETTGLKAA